MPMAGLLSRRPVRTARQVVLYRRPARVNALLSRGYDRARADRNPVVSTSAQALSYSRAMASRSGQAVQAPDGARLDRTSFVPLYYQLQEVLKEQIESGVWAPGAALPSEPELARRFGIRRVVVRQALAILQDDRQIVRVKGRGTFVAQPKLDARAGGLSRLLLVPRGPDVVIQTLDVRPAHVEDSIRRELGVEP